MIILNGKTEKYYSIKAGRVSWTLDIDKAKVFSDLHAAREVKKRYPHIDDLRMISTNLLKRFFNQ